MGVEQIRRVGNYGGRADSMFASIMAYETGNWT
jgi:hypothetical protein